MGRFLSSRDAFLTFVSGIHLSLFSLLCILGWCSPGSEREKKKKERKEIKIKQE